MGMSEAEIADIVLAAARERRQIAPFAGLSLPAAYRAAALVRDKRRAEGGRVVGRKIGFTNRGIWDEYGVHGPIWGYVYDRTLHEMAEPVRAADFVEPRIEPEIVFGLARPIGPQMGLAEIAAAVGWVAHGFEIVQSLYPGWRFAAPDTVAAFGLHGGLWIGPRRPLAPGEPERLESFEIALARDGVEVDRGQGRHVLDGPLHALAHLAAALADDPDHPPLDAGEIVTTGTLTRAFPIEAGEVWTTALTGLDLPGARLAVA
jgi:2-oxo-3-hexenedioate decarboxylase